MARKNVIVTFDDDRKEFVINTEFEFNGIPEFEASGLTLGDAFESLAQYLQDAGI